MIHIHTHARRHATLDILERLIPNEPLRPFRGRMADMALNAVRRDNEENAVLGIKVLANLHKAYRGQLEEYVQPSFQLVVDMYRVSFFWLRLG